MKFEIELPDKALSKIVESVLSNFLYMDNYGNVKGKLYEEIRALAVEQAVPIIEALNLRGIIFDRIEEYLIPTVHDHVKKLIDAEAKKAVKNAMKEPAK